MSATGNEYVKLSQLKGTVDAIKDKIDGVEGEIPAVVDNTTSTATDSALSANQGKILQGQIDNLKNIGRFLAIWNATTGVPTSNPEESPYTYRTGDYFRIGVVGNRIPNGSQYVIGGTNYTTTTDTLSIGDVYYYDGTSWNRQASSGGGTVQDVQVNGTSVLSGGIANIDLSGKADDSSVVHKSGNETIAGTKSFTNGIATDNINSVGTRVYFGSRVQQLEFQNSNLVKSADVGYGVACAFKTKALMSNTTYTEKLAYRTSTSTGNGKVFNIPTSKADGTYTLAITDDLPTKTSDLTNDSGFLIGYTVSLYNGVGGNPNHVKFLSVNYNGTDSNNSPMIKLGMICGHGNATSYTFNQDVIISVGPTGNTSVENFKYYGENTTYEGSARKYGDIFYTVDTTNKVVDFYVLLGQYSTMKSTPYMRVNSSDAGTITQHTSASYYGSGTKNWGKNLLYLTSDTSGCSIYCSDSNEISLGSNGSVIYIGYSNRVGSSGSVNTYKFGRHSGQDNSTGGDIQAGSLVIGNGASSPTGWKQNMDSSGNLVFTYGTY